MRVIDADTARTELVYFTRPTGIDEAPYEFASDIIDKMPTVEAIPIEWLKKHKCFNIIDLWEKECRLKDTKGILEELLSEHNFKSYNDYVEYARTITALPQEDRLDILFKEKENES